MRPLTVSFLLLLCFVVLHAEDVAIATDPPGRKVIVDDRAPIEKPTKIVLPKSRSTTPKSKNSKHKKKNHLKRYEKRTGYQWEPEAFFGFSMPHIGGTGTSYDNKKVPNTFPVRYTLGFKYGPFAGILDSIMPRYDMPFFVGAKFRYYPWESPTDNYGYYISLGLGYGGRGIDTGIDIMFDTGFQITRYCALSFFTEYMPMPKESIILFGLRLDIMMGGFLMKDRSKRFVPVKGRLKKR